jgi:hypothetical protein
LDEGRLKPREPVLYIDTLDCEGLTALLRHLREANGISTFACPEKPVILFAPAALEQRCIIDPWRCSRAVRCT